MRPQRKRTRLLASYLDVLSCNQLAVRVAGSIMAKTLRGRITHVHQPYYRQLSIAVLRQWQHWRTSSLIDLLRLRHIIVVSLGHLFLDLLSSTVSVVLTFFSQPMALSKQQISVANGLYSIVSSLLQPLAGHLADRYGSRWLGAGGLLWVLIFVSLTVMACQLGSYGLALVMLAFAGIGSAAFHPQGAMNATNVAEERRTTGASIFFFFGNIGMIAGPLLAGVLLRNLGPISFPLMAAAGLPVVWLLSTIGHRPIKESSSTGRVVTPSLPRTRLSGAIIAALVGLIALRSWANMGTTTFLPKFFEEAKGWDAYSYGMVASLWNFGTALGNLVGGPAADRWGRRRLVSWSLFALVPIMLYMPYSEGNLPFVLSGMGGFLSGLSFSVIMVLTQTLLPGGKGLASGLTLGSMFASGAIGSNINGFIADHLSLAISLQSIALVALGAGLCALVLPRTRPKPEPTA